MKTVNSSAPLVAYPASTRTARLIGRRQRFLVDLEDASGRFTAHTNNTGTMLGLTRPGALVLLSVSPTPGRKYPCTVEALRMDEFWVGVNTSMPTCVLRAAWQAGLLPGQAFPESSGDESGNDASSQKYTSFQTEPRFDAGRLDALLTGPGGELFIETKNVTLVEDGAALFPDAPSERARKHMGELARLARSGKRAAVFFAVQRPDASSFAPAGVIDPLYAQAFREALAAGVEAWAYVVDVAADGLRLARRLPLAPEECW